MSVLLPSAREAWPPLPYEPWRETLATLHRWTQIIGKIRLALAPMENQWWQVALYVTSRGLTTSPIPWGTGTFEIELDLLDHHARILDSHGRSRILSLQPRSVADFYRELMGRLRELGVDVAINTNPVEVLDDTPLDEDQDHDAYDREAVERFFHALSTADRLMKEFRARFTGKCSPVHFFWGSFDMAVTRFSGRAAPPHPGGIPNLPDHVVREAYAEEVSSCGFWPGGEMHPEPVFYSYAWPEPAGFRERRVRPPEAHWLETLSEYALPWEAARRADDPDDAVLDFFQSTYEAAAELGGWDRGSLERPHRRA